MAKAFLIQIGGDSYNRLVQRSEYLNTDWAHKRRDSAHGEVEPGDNVLFYCTGGVSQHSMSLAVSALVESVSSDKTLFHLEEVRWFRSPIPRDRIRGLVSSGELEEAFGSCGVQGFNITGLQPDSVARISELVEATEGAPTARVGPLDALIETKLEDYIVQNWPEIDFGSRLRLYVEEGESVGQQYDTREIGRIDLLCEDEDAGDIVIIELKKGRPSDEVVGQLARYMGWAQDHIAQGRKVRGVVLAPDFDAKLRYAVRPIPGVDLLRYRVRFDITREPM